MQSSCTCRTFVSLKKSPVLIQLSSSIHHVPSWADPIDFTQVILPDYLPDNPYSPLNQPVWCSYANAARSAVLISQLGTIFYQQEWLNTDELGIAIDAYWEQEGQGTWEGHGNGSPKGTRLAKKARAGTVLNNLQEKREHEEEGPTSP